MEWCERYGELIYWAMVILNPLEPWPVGLSLAACEQHGVKVLTRVVDHGGLFHGDLADGHVFKPGDHRTFRPEGWVGHGMEKIAKMRPVAEKYGLSLLEFAAIWNLSHPAVESLVPTFMQEVSDGARPIEDKIRDFAKLPADIRFTPEEVEQVSRIGDNTGCMMLKGASQRHTEHLRPDEWPMRPDLLELAARYGLGDRW